LIMSDKIIKITNKILKITNKIIKIVIIVRYDKIAKK
jgi:hypothetical protein